MKLRTLRFTERRQLCRRIVNVGLLATFVKTASAAVIQVPTDQPTIVAAIGAANPGDEIVIEAGTYD
ncbi:MAG: hypothetical protein RMK20_16260, partial [Verrucomicrobiales bacterium]|nr:hypothetical protein [Verrucomicrobiales bacterium]